MAKKFHHSFEVCNCHKVTLGELLFVVKEKKASTLEDLAFHTDAGTSCKCCISQEEDRGEEKMELYLEEILNKFNKK